MTNQELAQNLLDAERRNDVDDIIYYENEICGRLNLPLAWTEQGLNPQAANAITAFCRSQGV